MAAQSPQSQMAQAATKAAAQRASPSQTAGEADEILTKSPSPLEGEGLEGLNPSETAGMASETPSPNQTEGPHDKFGMNVSMSIAELLSGTAKHPVTALALAAHLFE